MPTSTPAAFGEYLLLRRIAFGSMAEIFLARPGPSEHGEPRDEENNERSGERHVALKLMLPHLCDDDAHVQLFLDEARLVSELSHPNVLQVFDFGEVGGRYFQAMEYLDGRNAAAVFRHAQDEEGSVPVDMTLQLVVAAAEGLDYAHKVTRSGRALGIVHRDVSPENIMLTRAGQVKVLDFGVAHVAGRGPDSIATGAVKGNAAYCSPEQLNGARVDARSDVFSLGVVLHELLTGRRLFRRATTPETLLAVVDADVPRVSELRPGLSSKLELVVTRALERDPDRRFGSALAFANDLRALISGDAEPLRVAFDRLFGDG